MNPIVTEDDRKIFAEEFAGRLPRRIFDSHVHIVKKSSYPEGFEFGPGSCLNKFGKQFTVEQALSLYRELLPGIEVTLTGFGLPDMSVDRTDSADFGVDNDRVFGLRLLSAYDDAEKVEADILKYRLAGVKPYPNMAFRHEGQETELLDFFSPGQLRMLNRLKLIAVIHIPRKKRLEDPLNRKQMVQLCREYPDATFIFAHIGRAYYMRCVEGHLDELAECPNAYLDTAMINHAEVLKYAFDHFPAERILFGSDAPISFLHGKSVEINHQYAYITPENFDLGTCIHDSGNAVRYAPFLYEQLRSVLSLNLPPETLEGFFHGNAGQLYSTTIERMYGK